MNIIEGKHVHGNILQTQRSRKRGEERIVFDAVFSAYEAYREKVEELSIQDENGIRDIVDALNEYRKVAIPVFDKQKNSGQNGLGSTVIEEFFYLLFEKKMAIMGIEHDNMFIGKGNSYVSLSFTPSSFQEMFSKPAAYIHTKDQDFVLGASVNININADGTEDLKSTVIPVVAIECKTYLERNMLDSCAATASRLKNAMPYCIYIVASEYMKMDEATPELTDIDEVYILCHAKNTDRQARQTAGEPPIDIDPELIIDLYRRVDRHLNAIWWKPENAVELGKIINRPR